MKPNEAYFKIIEKSEIFIEPEFLSEDFCHLRLETIQAYQALSDVLKKMGKNFFDLKIARPKNKKPYFKNSEIKFNYSHSKNFIAIVISLDEVGIDIEEKDRKIDDAVAEKFLDGARTQKQRLETWVKKEAYCKTLGLGVGNFSKIDLKTVTFPHKFINQEKFFCAIYSENQKTKFKTQP